MRTVQFPTCRLLSPRSTLGGTSTFGVTIHEVNATGNPESEGTNRSFRKVPGWVFNGLKRTRTS